MVVAIACAGEAKLRRLEGLGVRDSKLLTPARRERLRRVLEQLLDYFAVRVVQPEEVDRAVQGLSFGNLNELELSLMAELIQQALERVSVEKVYVDSPDPLPERFGRRLSQRVGTRVEVVAESHADSKYVIVSAASIIAKTERDRIIRELKSTYGDFGSGYPSDPKTREFVKRWIEREGSLPPIVRKSWSTLERL
ncbi:ribonuclease HII [Infirmifilum lucidum]|uniref:Ribonuclease n=2 Tax=Infirmifilum lucidum TaxID=2776706 RepID=A0A7L9FJ57_9CREN|nr:ribonuclease HII [Infirmifilum lucidum]